MAANITSSSGDKDLHCFSSNYRKNYLLAKYIM
jgi:hypothetical protein